MITAIGSLGCGDAFGTGWVIEDMYWADMFGKDCGFEEKK